jgi:hypothetical protein
MLRSRDLSTDVSSNVVFRVQTHFTEFYHCEMNLRLKRIIPEWERSFTYVLNRVSTEIKHLKVLQERYAFRQSPNFIPTEI